MAEVTITLTFNIQKEDERLVWGIIADSLADFRAVRQRPTVKDYVDQRYPPTADYDWLDREEKVEEVSKRIEVCLQMSRTINIRHSPQSLPTKNVAEERDEHYWKQGEDGGTVTLLPKVRDPSGYWKQSPC